MVDREDMAVGKQRQKRKIRGKIETITKDFPKVEIKRQAMPGVAEKMFSKTILESQFENI
jgi:hypothetical protein